MFGDKFSRKQYQHVVGTLGLAAATTSLVMSLTGAGYPGTLRSGVEQALYKEKQLVLDPESPIHWVDSIQETGINPWQSKTAILLARSAADAPRDVYRIEVTRSFNGGLDELENSFNISQTSLADESGLTGHNHRMVWRIGDTARVYRIEYADLQGARTSEEESWGKLANFQRNLTNLQETGQMQKILRRSFKLEPSAARVDLSVTASGFSIVADGQLTVVPNVPTARIHGARFAIEQVRASARPGALVPWTVDRVRAFEWFGSERMQWVKAVAYRIRDWFGRRRTRQPVPPSRNKRKVELPPSAAVHRSADTLPSQWPPAPLVPLLDPVLNDEGQWASLSGDPYVGSASADLSPFTTTFLRTDPERPDSQVLVVLWDPHRVVLNFAAGTREPKSALGEIGSGLIPRSHPDFARLVGAFNGAFQTSHGAWGAQADNRLYLPPKPYGATVVQYQDGATGFGTWPASDAIPKEIRSFRQNLTPLIAHSVFNPYQRTWWGGVPDGWADDTRTVRSGLCETESGHVAYFYGSRVDHEHLAKAMQVAHCRYAIHLDMNSGHTGFEFYRLGAELPALPASSIDPNWQAQGRVPAMPSLGFRARKLSRDMNLMNFPRYVHRQTRDFFYLTERQTLPRKPLAGAFPESVKEGRWTVPNSSAEQFPQPLTTTWLRPDRTRPETKVRLLQIDLSWVRPSRSSPQGELPLATLLPPPAPDRPSGSPRILWVKQHRGQISNKRPPPGAIVLASEEWGNRPNLAAWGTIGPNLLVYAEVVTAAAADRNGPLLQAVLRSAGCSATLLTHSSQPALNGATDLSGHPVEPASTSRIQLLRRDWPALRPLFPDTEVVGPGTWYYLQH